MMSKKWLLSVGASAVLALGVTACGDDDESDSSSSGGGDLSGTISLDGSSTVQPFAEAAGELFKEENDGVDTTVGAAGTSGGFEKFCAGEIDISNASREIEPEEEKLCQEGGVKYTGVQVANDGISVVTNPEVEISLPDNRSAQAAVGAGLEGHQLQRPRRGRRHRRTAARRRHQPLWARHRFGDIRLLHRRDQR